MTTDPVADLLTRIRNAIMVKKTRVDIPASNLKKDIVDVLCKEGFVRRYKIIKDDKQGVLRVYLKYTDSNDSVIHGLKRVSRPGLRVYVAKDKLPVVNNDIGVGLISTSPRGVITSKEARKHGVGGEYLCKIW